MSVAHLAGKRTGRPPGSKTTPPWRRDVIWAYRNLGHLDAVPPSPLAGLLLEMGRREPDRLFACLASLDAAPGQQSPAPMRNEACAPAAVPTPCAPAAVPTPSALDRRGPGRLRHLFIRECYLVRHLKGGIAPGFLDLPGDVHIVDVALDGRRKGLIFLVHSQSFPLVQEGELVPELEAEFT
jgi:hypothetical protein